MNPLLAWFKGKSGTVHAIGATLLALVAFLDSPPGKPVRDFLIANYDHHGKIGIALTLISIAVAAYKNPSSRAGAVAKAREVLDSPQAPTAKEVDQATPKP